MNTSLAPLPDSGATTFPNLTRRDLQPVVDLADRFLGCDHLAQDAVQESLIALSQQAEQPAHPVAWLTSAVIHRCRHLRRSVRRRRHHEHQASQHCELHVDCDNPVHVAVAHEIGDLLTAVRDALPSDQRTALDLYESEGQDYRGIAKKLGVPIGTVRSRLGRAREALRAAVSKRYSASA